MPGESGKPATTGRRKDGAPETAAASGRPVKTRPTSARAPPVETVKAGATRPQSSVEGEVGEEGASVTARPASMTTGDGQEVGSMVRVVGD